MRRPTCDGVETTVMDVTILCLVLLIQVILFAGHCTPFADLLMGTQDAISYIGITLPVQVVAGLLLVPAMLLTLWQIISITCLGKRTLRRARRESVTRDILATKSSVMAIFDCVSFVFTPASSYYFVVMYLLTAQSFLAQALGVHGKARRGYGPVALTLLTTFILLNGLAPVASALIVRRINRTADNDFYQRRIEASRWIVQLLLFEACCDLVYAFFPLAHFFARYSRITGGGTFEAGVIQAYADHTHESVVALEGAVLINEAEGTFFGSSSSLDIFIKLFSQMFPLLMAPIRIRLAFTIRQNATAGINQEKAAKMEWKSRRVPARGAFYFKNGGKAAKVQEMESVNEEPAGDFDAMANDAETASAGSPTADIESGDGETQAAQPDLQTAEQLHAKAGKEAALPNTAETLDAVNASDIANPAAPADSVAPTSTELKTDGSTTAPARDEAGNEGGVGATERATTKENDGNGDDKAAAIDSFFFFPPSPNLRAGTTRTRTKRFIRCCVRASAFKRRYRPVPRWALGLYFISLISFTLAVYIQLATWGECPIPEMQEKCVVRAFPIFQLYAGADEWSCRSCACNTLLYAHDANCTELAQANRSTATTSSGCHAPPEHLGKGGLRYASMVLDSSPAILQSAINIFVQACPSDTDLLQTLESHAHMPAYLRIDIARENITEGSTSPSSSSSSSSSSSTAAAATTGHGAVVTWEFPPRFGYRWPKGSSNQIWPLTSFVFGRIRAQIPYHPKPNHHDVRSIRLANLPSTLGRMTALRALELSQAALTEVPPSVASFINLQDLNFNSNEILVVPSFIGQLPRLRGLGVTTNLISSVPSSIGQLASMQHLHLQNNVISSVPPSFGRLTNLKELWLLNNTLTTIPASLLTAPRSPSSPNFYLNLEANNISLAAMTVALADISSSVTDPPSSLVLLGRNPVCSGNGSLASRKGPWQVKCGPECASGCLETGIGQVKSWVGDGTCSVPCNAASCKWDEGECAKLNALSK